MAVGFFMGSVVATSQLFFLLCLIYIGYHNDHKHLNKPAKEETFMAFFSLIMCLLLGSFAAILGAHRSEILDKNLDPNLQQFSNEFSEPEDNAGGGAGRYEPPRAHA
eukprot:CAMPEP_0116834192 /NCGR_PEP_ID=MMETSP0418-20121206/6854_1 /TAXON_ID=1158023 /ORGANISM="Astrosyne radiata, Strain 13vi08-1A" /LENGTH=106 /DNA_ID=CAMNT_0004463723 /DNA_START=218 /DNA_END=538 /DNA_ORIENTATION=+